MEALSWYPGCVERPQREGQRTHAQTDRETERKAVEGRADVTVLDGRALPGEAAGGTGALSEGQLRNSSWFLAVVPPLALC